MIDYAGVGTLANPATTAAVTALNSVFSNITSANSGNNFLGKYSWSVTLAQALAGAFLSIVPNTSTPVSYIDIIKTGLLN